MFKNTKRVFLDYASTTPVDDLVLKEMIKFHNKKFHNPSSLYREGLSVADDLEKARLKVARITQSKPDEVIFTGSGTESDNLGIIGTVNSIIKKINLDGENKNFRPHIITTNIEHVAVLESIKFLESEGIDVTYLEVNEKGLIFDKDVYKALRKETVLVSIMLANNEIGTIMPIRPISVQIDKYKNEINRKKHDYPYLHTDASQAPNYLDVNVDKLGVDLMTLDGSKIYGPKGVGCLIVKNFVPIEPILHGGGQENKIRPGTENMAGIFGFAKALEIADELRETESIRIEKLRDYFWEKIKEKIPKSILNGDYKKRIPNNLNICIPGINSEFVVIQLDEEGISCAAATACKNLSGDMGSYVVDSLYKKTTNNSHRCGSSSLRFTLGRNTKKSDIDFAISKLTKIINV